MTLNQAVESNMNACSPEYLDTYPGAQFIHHNFVNEIYDDLIEDTFLADGWNWEIEYFHFALDNFNPAQLVLAGSGWVEDYM